MKRRLILLLTLLLCLPTVVQAQTEQSTNIELIVVDLWPDFDQASVLVLITGALPIDTTLPATVTIPLPDDASLNAVARITSENSMIDDIEFTQNADSVTLTTPDPQFRIEYYMPYTASDNDRSFTFSWMADVAVGQLEVSVQQPAAASSMNVVPTPTNITASSGDNLNYHILPISAVATGELYEVRVNYEMTEPQLTIDLATQPQPTAQTAVSPPPVAGNNTNLPLILGVVGGVLIVAVLAWALVNNQKTTPRPRKPTPRRKTAVKSSPPPARLASAAIFCHEGGEGLQAGDKFCRECGTAVKST
ncbi:MAG: hypothetical protein DWQ04_05095 [Chloroflexi bacterium]|nr:MAG: hypothetical protein DWQ04_05095 [Chloroflexota bacterium]